MSNEATIALSPAILRAIAVGIDRLNDGDTSDCANADEAEKVLAAAGYVVSRGTVCPVSETYSGYVKRPGKNIHTFKTASGEWYNAEIGEDLYLDMECTIFLRKTGA